MPKRAVQLLELVLVPPSDVIDANNVEQYMVQCQSLSKFAVFCLYVSVEMWADNILYQRNSHGEPPIQLCQDRPSGRLVEQTERRGMRDTHNYMQLHPPQQRLSRARLLPAVYRSTPGVRQDLLALMAFIRGHVCLQ